MEDVAVETPGRGLEEESGRIGRFVFIGASVLGALMVTEWGLGCRSPLASWTSCKSSSLEPLGSLGGLGPS